VKQPGAQATTASGSNAAGGKVGVGPGGGASGMKQFLFACGDGWAADSR
jgi:hypothetical protein